MSSTNPSAAQRLEILRGLRLRGQAPVGAVCVATDRDDVKLFEELKRPVIEVWRRDAGRLDWTPIAGLWVVVLIRNWPTDLRMELFDRLRVGNPQELNWLATSRTQYDAREIVGRLWLVGGEPREMWVPEDMRRNPQGGSYSYGCV